MVNQLEMYGFDQDPHGDLENFTTYMFVPICFEGVNGLGEGGFYDGIPVDYAVNDDLTKDWGDQEEACLAAAIQYISSGSVTVKKSYVEIPQIRKKGLQAEIGAY